MVTKIGSAIYLYMNGEKVGRLSRKSAGKLELMYDDSWLTSPSRRPLSLSLPLGKTPFTGEVVHNFFENLLPDSSVIRRRIQARFKTGGTDSYDLLWHIGRDCVGAIQLLPDNTDHVDVRNIQSKPLNDTEIATMLSNYRTMPLGMAEDGDFRISIAGAQEKTALLLREGKWHQPLGTTPTTHIFKLPIGKNTRFDLSDSVENEWLCHLILKELSVPIAEAAIHTFDEAKALVVTRFDRRMVKDGSWIVRLPQEDICQAKGIHPGLKYENNGGPGIVDVIALLRGSMHRVGDNLVFWKTQVIFWLLAAIDGHGKNFSIFLQPEGRYHLTPIYDVISAHPLLENGGLVSKRIKMAMALKGKTPHYAWERIKYRHWLNTARLCGFPVGYIEGIITEVLDTMDQAIEVVGAQVPEGPAVRVAESIFKGMRIAREMLIKSKTEEGS